VNACRKLGRGGKAEAPVAAQQVAAQAPARAAGDGDSSVEGASGLGSSGVGASLVEKVLGAAETSWLRLARMGGVTGSVSDQTSRLAQGPTTPGAGHVRPSEARTARQGQRWLMVTAGERSSNCATTRGRRCRLRSSDIAVQGVGPTVAWACGRRSSGGSGGRNGANRADREWQDPAGAR